MRLYPAIDIKDGKCVRLKKGLFNEVTVYSDKPYEIAESFEADGAKFIHTVDLDGARGGHSVNSETIKKIVDSVSVPVQLGGGIRTLEDIETVLNLGIYRAIIGTKAVENPDFIRQAIENFGAEHASGCRCPSFGDCLWSVLRNRSDSGDRRCGSPHLQP